VPQRQFAPFEAAEEFGPFFFGGGAVFLGGPACIRCPLLRPDPAQRPRLAEIRDNLIARIGEAQREGWAGEAEGLQVSLAVAGHKLVQMDQITARRRATVIHLGMPGLPPAVSRIVTTPAAGPVGESPDTI
jgi:hypothetical protein